MTYIEQKPKKIFNRNKEKTLNCIKVSYAKGKETARVYIGRNVAQKMNIDENDRVLVFIDDENRRKWFIKKSPSDYEGFKVTIGSYKTTCYKVLFPFKEENVFIKKCDWEIKIVPHAHEDDGIVIFI
jgi:predicted SPOUT superfamily RNA methylase MTH1